MVRKFSTFGSQLEFAERSAGPVVHLTNEQKLSLYKKSQKHGIPTDILEEVYRRGYTIWNESFGQTAEQFAFDRVNSFIAGGFAAELDEDLRQWFNPNHPKGGWKRYNSKGEAIGPCAREPGEAKPKCMSNEKAASLSKKERAKAVAAKRRNDPNPDRKGKPINVSNYGKGKLLEMTDITEENKPTNPELWSKAKSLARQKFNVYPSAYANGWAAKWYKSKGGGWKSVKEEVEGTVEEAANAAQQAAIAIAMKKKGIKPKNEETEVDEACWTGYKQVGMKKKGNRMVPNCVPVKEEIGSKKKYDPGHMVSMNQPWHPEDPNVSFRKDFHKEKQKEIKDKLDNMENDLQKMKQQRTASENYTGAEATSSNFKKPNSRFIGTNELTQVYKDMTPGQSETKKRIKVIKETVLESYVCENCNCGLAEELINERGEDSKGYKRPTEQGAGLTQKGVEHYRRENPGSKLSTAVTEKNPTGRRAARRRSFCARMSGVKGPMKDEKGRPTRKAMSLRRWRC